MNGLIYSSDGITGVTGECRPRSAEMKIFVLHEEFGLGVHRTAYAKGGADKVIAMAIGLNVEVKASTKG